MKIKINVSCIPVTTPLLQIQFLQPQESRDLTVMSELLSLDTLSVTYITCTNTLTYYLKMEC